MAAKDFARGCLLSIVYCAVFLLLRRWSVDQWYLPAGLRLVTLLLLPWRQWPYLLIGDIAAVLMLRVPMVEVRGYNIAWAYVSAFFYMPIVSFLPLIARSHIPNLTHKNHWLLALALMMAIWGSCCSLAFNAVLGGPQGSAVWQTLVKYTLGDFLGMLMLLLPALLWQRRPRSEKEAAALLRHAVWTLAAVGALFVAIALSTDVLLKQLLMLALIAPAIGLTLRHGWRGAALGIVVVNVAVALSLPKVSIDGYFSADVFNVQLLLSAVAIGLVAFGTQLSAAYANARSFSQSRDQALQMAHSGYLSSERAMRNRVAEYTDINVQLNRLRRNAITYLRTRGHYAAAMEMTRSGLIQARLLDNYVDVLYPLAIETHGLYHVLASVSLANKCDTEFRCRLLGDPRRMSVGLQLAAYRCLLNAVEFLPLARRHLVKARVWQSRGRLGVAVQLIADASVLDAVPRGDETLEGEFLDRLTTHGGTCRRRHALSLSFLVSEPVQDRISSRMS
ncbi:histidine kinase [Xanthomonas cerealis pv. cerealis]|uniref:Histidine kinase n=1 Tax=Xanthomonas cerealis pv. cerealis TaxID=152263 RepID=A0A514ECX2_9XANT|nr:MASE1 domain-containing protein [Xanthomonas translucens]QDI03835.1 histidine kinase [Xanthomonas translucens pv. cerealis]WLA10273.1 MASE1 domain-containing protein [Xanthomonas translucens]